jgi:uncharacterized membrane protein HdeD (DUF308 family)
MGGLKMNKRVFLLLPIILIAFGLVLLALVGASAAVAEKPTGVNDLTSVTNPLLQDPINLFCAWF